MQLVSGNRRKEQYLDDFLSDALFFLVLIPNSNQVVFNRDVTI